MSIDETLTWIVTIPLSEQDSDFKLAYPNACRTRRCGAGGLLDADDLCAGTVTLWPDGTYDADADPPPPERQITSIRYDHPSKLAIVTLAAAAPTELSITTLEQMGWCATGKPAAMRARTLITEVTNANLEERSADPELNVWNLSPREWRVAVHLARTGASNADLAVQLGVSEGTVKVHIRRILRLMDANNRTHLAVTLFQHLAQFYAKDALLDVSEHDAA